jgi:cytochrome b subunit of formate dehydrogenase
MNAQSVWVRCLERLLAGATLLALPVLLAAPTLTRAASPDCLGCHGDEVHADSYARSAHKDLACTACHAPTEAKPLRPASATACVAEFTPMDCARCHEKQADEHAASVHNGKRLPVACWECHEDIHLIQPLKGNRLAAVELCSSCHSRQEPYFASVHYEGLKQGNPDSPGCMDCHGAHAIAKIDNDAAGRDFHTRACLDCHADSALTARNELKPIAAETFFNSYHGKNVRLGYPEQVAGCSDCHSSHAVLKVDDPNSTVGEIRRVETCRQCHTNAGPSFARYLAHGDDRDRAASPALYWTRISMTALLVGTFLFFWLHSLLWAFRSFVERQQAAARAGHAEPASARGPRRSFRRFSTLQIVLHLTVIVSFLALALTGLPLKFSGTGWGHALMAAIGGTDRARLIHHTAAVITFGYFLTALVLSARFLFSRTGSGTFRSRLLGPDSLCPNGRDWTDFRAMLRWFVFRGPKPSFERWTYWEKFDFLAVFWGMLAIGGSGILLWFPEFFARFLPGWWFNVATIIHSDEALLATGFIFTVHFFNTHFRPEKFPMDTVIFNGRVSEEEMREERADQLRRYEAEGRVDEFLSETPLSLPWEFSYRILGLVAVGVGLALAALMTYTLLAGGL